MAEQVSLGRILFNAFALTVFGALVIYLYNFPTVEYKEDCEMRTICSDYKSNRDICATAGSYKTCMSIKMGEVNLSRAQVGCLEDGSMSYRPEHSPNAFVCNVAWAKGLLTGQ
jgi:hypothetical protein